MDLDHHRTAGAGEGEVNPGLLLSSFAVRTRIFTAIFLSTMKGYGNWVDCRLASQ